MKLKNRGKNIFEATMRKYRAKKGGAGGSLHIYTAICINMVEFFSTR